MIKGKKIFGHDPLAANDKNLWLFFAPNHPSNINKMLRHLFSYMAASKHYFLLAEFFLTLTNSILETLYLISKDSQ